MPQHYNSRIQGYIHTPLLWPYNFPHRLTTRIFVKLSPERSRRRRKRKLATTFLSMTLNYFHVYATVSITDSSRRRCVSFSLSPDSLEYVSSWKDGRENIQCVTGRLRWLPRVPIYLSHLFFPIPPRLGPYFRVLMRSDKSLISPSNLARTALLGISQCYCK